MSLPRKRLASLISSLDGGADGLDFVRRIAEGARAFLVPGGVLAMEIGMGEHDDTRAILEKAGFRDIEIARDLARIERVVSGVL